MNFMRKIFVTTVIFGVFAGSAFALPVAFTGDAVSDFAGSNAVFFGDINGGIGDVGLSGGGISSFATPSGFDFVGIYMQYDLATDTMFIGIDMLGIAGDTNGDGNPYDEGFGISQIDFTESVILGIDLDGDAGYLTADFEVLIGIDFFSFGNGEIEGGMNINFPSLLFTDIDPLMVNPPVLTVVGDDVEFAISGFAANVLGVTPTEDLEFAFNAFSDGGMGGEDILGAQTYQVPEPGSVMMFMSALAFVGGYVRSKIAK